MLENINNIGSYLKDAGGEIELLDMMVNQIGGDSMEYIMEVNVTGEGIQTELIDYRRRVVKDALFYQAGNAFLGGGIRLDFYKPSKVKAACNFCEISNKQEEVQKTIEGYLANGSSKTFAIIKVDGKTPRELFEEKFLDKMYNTMYKKMEGIHICHLCGAEGEGYNTAIYKFYTNDKELYGDFSICKNCIENILLARDYIEDILSSYWLGRNVMFLPHSYNDKIAKIYQFYEGEEGVTNLLRMLRVRETKVLQRLGESKPGSLTDIVFYEKDGEKTFYIYHQIQGVLPSRFSRVAGALEDFKLKGIFVVLEYAAAVKIGIDSAEPTEKEKMRIIEAIFKGRPLDRSLFFKRAMDVYKMHYMNDRHQYTMLNINRVYNFLCRCGCLEKEWNVMKEYKSYEELFEENRKYFDSNEKKAWFILGKSYDYMIYRLKDKTEQKAEGEESKKTSLEKNFFSSRRFSFEDFIYLSNLLEDKAIKNSRANITFKNMMCEAKDYMAKGEQRLSQDEAKYLFFWGMNSYFKFEGEQKPAEQTEESEGGSI